MLCDKRNYKRIQRNFKAYVRKIFMAQVALLDRKQEWNYRSVLSQQFVIAGAAHEANNT